MQSAVALTIILVFVTLAAWHFWMAVSPGAVITGVVPTMDDSPVFVPSSALTVVVGLLLLGCAALISAASGVWQLHVPQRLLTWLCYGLAAGLTLRAIGDFKYVGFFKRVRGSRFAVLDSLVYSPLCLVLAAGVLFSARPNGA